MAVKVKLCFAVLLLSLLVLCTGFALADDDRDIELKQCKHQCEVQRQFGEDQKEQCKKQCDSYVKRKEEREREREEREKSEEREREKERGGGGSGRRHFNGWNVMEEVDPEKKLRQCLAQCERQEGEQRQLCRFRCQQKYSREQGKGDEEEEEEEELQGGKEEENPYVFEDKHFKSTVESEHGRVSVLPEFTKKLLRGIENFRVGVVEADPLTFVAPSHWDADAVLFVAKGRGIITMILPEKSLSAKHQSFKRQSFKLECGDLITVPAGTPVHFVNRDENEKLFIIKLLIPVNLPGEYKTFFGPGGRDPESFFKAFSPELLDAALQTDRGRWERIFRQDQGVIRKASKEQIEAMSHRIEGGGIWPFGGETSGPLNLLRKTPVVSNNYGQLFQAAPEDCWQLEQLGLTVSVANISRGSMIGPYYNSRANKIAIVLDAEGKDAYWEMACPHVSSSDSSGEQGKGGSRGGKSTSESYQRLRARLRRGTVVLTPAGHPVASVAPKNSNLILLSFEVHSKGNTRYFLAGRNNFINEMEKEAQELAFGVPSREVRQVFGKTDGEFFFPGPSRQREQRQMEGGAFE